jgi:hypothetical protein
VGTNAASVGAYAGDSDHQLRSPHGASHQLRAARHAAHADGPQACGAWLPRWVEYCVAPCVIAVRLVLLRCNTLQRGPPARWAICACVCAYACDCPPALSAGAIQPCRQIPARRGPIHPFEFVCCIVRPLRIPRRCCVRGRVAWAQEGALGPAVRIDISFDGPMHSGLDTVHPQCPQCPHRRGCRDRARVLTPHSPISRLRPLQVQLVHQLVVDYPSLTPLVLVLKQMLTNRGLDHACAHHSR